MSTYTNKKPDWYTVYIPSKPGYRRLVYVPAEEFDSSHDRKIPSKSWMSFWKCSPNRVMKEHNNPLEIDPIEIDPTIMQHNPPLWRSGPHWGRAWGCFGFWIGWATKNNVYTFGVKYF